MKFSFYSLKLVKDAQFHTFSQMYDFVNFNNLGLHYVARLSLIYFEL